MNRKRMIPALILAAALLFALAACSSSDILPPKDGAESAPAAPMPTPTPTPMPTPFAGGIDALEINQALSYGADADTGALYPMKNFVSGRDTAVFVRLSGALGHAPDMRDYLELYRGSELLATLSPDETSTEDCLCYFLKNGEELPLDAGEYTVHAVADDASMTRGFTLTDTRALNVLMLPVRGCFGGEVGYPEDGWQNSFAFVQSCWPLRNDGVNAVKGQGLDLSAESYDLRTERGLWNAWEALCARVGMLGEYDLVVGFVSGEMGEGADCGCFGRDGVALLDVSQENAQAVLSHFAAQTLGAGDEYEGGAFNLAVNPAPNASAGFDAETREMAVSVSGGVKRAASVGLACGGSLVPAEQVPFDVYGLRFPGDAASFMSDAKESEEHYWISADLWNFLFDTLQGEKTLSPFPKNSTGKLRLAGLLGRDGSFALRGAVCADENSASVTPLRDSGAYSVIVSGADGATLYFVYFEPDFLCLTDPPADRAYASVDMTIPVPDGAEKLEIYGPAVNAEGEVNANALLYTRDMTPPEQAGVFSVLPTGEALRGIARFEWVNISAETPAEETEEEDEDLPPELPPEPDYELYMCYDGVRLLVYRGKTSYTELDMPSLPKPEECTFLLLTTCGGRSACVESEPVTIS